MEQISANISLHNQDQEYSDQKDLQLAYLIAENGEQKKQIALQKEQIFLLKE